MTPDIFYTNKNDHAIPLQLIATADWDNNPLLARQGFEAKLGQWCIVIIDDKPHAFVGRGTASDVEAMAHAATSLPAGTYALAHDVSLFALSNWALAQYLFDAYKKNPRPPRCLVLSAKHKNDVLHECEAIFLTRDLINSPPNVLTPEGLSDATQTLASHHNATFKSWVGDELLTAGFPAIHAVGRAGASAPRLLQLTAGNPAHPRVTLIGKGVCFDSGGLDIKPSSAMRLMKKDMGGAAHVLGLAHWLLSKKLPIYLNVLIPAVENVVSSNAFKPGDIITMRNGLTVEIDNTDAEGRLILADACAYAAETPSDCILQFATLTGAARIAVGTDIAALFTPDDDLAAGFMASSKVTGDEVWRLPLHAPYAKLLHSSIADLANASNAPFAGAITAALFLQRFLPTTPWAHFDIMAWNLSNSPGKPEGGEALGLRAAAHYLASIYG